MSDMFDLSDLGVRITPPTTGAERFSALIYGRMKVGKSYLAATAAEVEALSPILWIAAEDGTASFGDQYGDKIDVLRATDAQQVLNLIYKMTERKSDGALAYQTKYKTVVLDTIGAYQNVVKTDYIKKHGAMDFAGWGAVGDFPVAIVEELQNSPYNSIFLAHHVKEKDDVSGQLLIMPDMLGNVAIKRIPPLVDAIFYLAKADDKDSKTGSVRVLQTQATSRIDAGGRFESKLPAQMVEPSFKKIYEAITAK